MSIANTSFFNTYQLNQGLVYSKTYQQLLVPTGPYYLMVNTRQFLVTSLSTTEVSSAINVINSSLQAENSLKSLNLNPINNINQSLNSFFQTVYGSYLRDYFTGLTNSVNIAWSNSFKDSWEKTTGNELVQQIGLATWMGSSYIFYPASSPITNLQTSASISTIINNTLIISGFGTDICAFALPGFTLSFGTGTLPPPSLFNISTTTVVAIASTNSLTLSSKPLGGGSTVFAFRQLANAEYLEFRFGTSSITGLAATQIFSNFNLSVTLQTNLGLTTTIVGINSNNPTGRVNIGTYGLPTYLATDILGIFVTSGVLLNPYLQTLEVWVKSIN